jgi:hypothetical protein
MGFTAGPLSRESCVAPEQRVETYSCICTEPTCKDPDGESPCSLARQRSPATMGNRFGFCYECESVRVTVPPFPSQSKGHSITLFCRKGRMSRVEILLPRNFRADLVAFITATSVILGPLVVSCPTRRHSIFPSQPAATSPNARLRSVQP